MIGLAGSGFAAIVYSAPHNFFKRISVIMLALSRLLAEFPGRLTGTTHRHTRPIYYYYSKPMAAKPLRPFRL
jgi:hypothetical protein